MTYTDITVATVDPHAPTEPEIEEAIAELLDDPLPPDWRDADAVAARQAALATAAHAVGEAALELVLARAEAQQQGVRLDVDTPAVRHVSVVMAALSLASDRYARDTRRSDGQPIIMGALERSAGATIAAWVVDAFDRANARVRQERIEAHALNEWRSDPRLCPVIDSLDALMAARTADGQEYSPTALEVVRSALIEARDGGLEMEALHLMLAMWTAATGGPEFTLVAEKECKP